MCGRCSFPSLPTLRIRWPKLQNEQYWLETSTIFTARIRRMGEGNFSVFSMGRGYLRPRIFPRSLVPGPFWGYPSPSRGIPQSWWGEGTTELPVQGVLLSGGCCRTGGPLLGLRYPLTGIGYPPPKTKQQSECLLRSGRCASYGHAGGLSCLNDLNTNTWHYCFFFFKCPTFFFSNLAHGAERRKKRLMLYGWKVFLEGQ